MKITKSYNEVIENINNFLPSRAMEKEIFFDDGFFLRMRKDIANGSQNLEIHTSGYDGTLEITEAIEWIKWTLYDYKANGILI